MLTRIVRTSLIVLLGLSFISRGAFWYVDSVSRESRNRSIAKVVENAKTHGFVPKSTIPDEQLEEVLRAPLPYLIKVPIVTVVSEPLKWVPFYILHYMRNNPVQRDENGEFMYRTNTPTVPAKIVPPNREPTATH